MKKSFQQILEQYKANAFGDIPVESLDADSDKDFVIERLLEHGGMEGIRWLLENYGADAVKNVVKNSRKLSRRTGTFWGAYFSIPFEEIRCLSKATQSHSQ